MTQKQTLRAIGLMSGTSMDGVDAAYLETDGETVSRFGDAETMAYAPQDRALLRQALHDATFTEDRNARPGALHAAEAFITRVHAEAVERLIARMGLASKDIDLVGFHGQTVLHRPERRLTVQIGDGEGLARRLGLPVAFDFRAADVAAGGQGAPLVPVFHQALAAARADLPRPLAVLNVGGVSNVTFLDGPADPVAGDTGPGNALLDDFMLERRGVACDRDGALAASGQADESVLAELLDHPYFAGTLPKSLDRNAFSRSAVARLSDADGAATLTAFSARATARIVPHLPSPPKLWIVGGGGARNPTFLTMLRDALHAEVTTADALGWNGDALEAQAFAFLAVRTWYGLPLTFPGTTGVTAPLGGGIVARPGVRPAARRAS